MNKFNHIEHKRIQHRHSIRRGNSFGEYGSSSPEVVRQKEYYWIWFDRDESHKGLWGAYTTYEEAERKAVSKLNVPYEIVKLSTRDSDRAREILMGKHLEQTRDVNKVFNRYSHTGSED